MKLSVIIPVYNEERSIGMLLYKVLAVRLGDEITKEIIVVDDGSSDETPHILKSFQGNRLFKILRHEKNQGKGVAVRRGIENATGDLILVQDADLEYDPFDYPELLRPLLAGRAQVVYGSRFKGGVRKMTLINQWGNRLATFSLNLLFRQGLTDVATGFKVFKRETIKGLGLSAQHFDFDTEVTVKLVRKKIKIQEVPIGYVARLPQDGKKMNWLEALRMYLGIFRYGLEK